MSCVCCQPALLVGWELEKEPGGAVGLMGEGVGEGVEGVTVQVRRLHLEEVSLLAEAVGGDGEHLSLEGGLGGGRPPLLQPPPLLPLPRAAMGLRMQPLLPLLPLSRHGLLLPSMQTDLRGRRRVVPFWQGSWRLCIVWPLQWKKHLPR